ncbi:MAG: hypothetical protein ACLUE1_03550 [Adlercreutzia equolifaciens]
MEYINAQPAGIRMGQGMQRVYNSHSPFRTVLRWPLWRLHRRGRRRVHAGGGLHPLDPRHHHPGVQLRPWANTGARVTW